MTITIDLRQPIGLINFEPFLNGQDFYCIGSPQHLKDALAMHGYNISQQKQIVQQVTLWGSGMGIFTRVVW